MVIIRTNIYIFLHICEHIFVSMDILKLSEAHTINLVHMCDKIYSMFFVFVRVFCERIVLLTFLSLFFLRPLNVSNISSAHQASENINLCLLSE